MSFDYKVSAVVTGRAKCFSRKCQNCPFCSAGENCVEPSQCPCEWEGSIFPPGTTVTQHCQNWLVNLFYLSSIIIAEKKVSSAFDFALCVVPVKMVCGGVKVWLVLLPPLPVWKQSLLVLGGAASHPTGCVTMRTTVVMGLMKSASRPALQTSSAVQAHQGDSSINSSFLFIG